MWEEVGVWVGLGEMDIRIMHYLTNVSVSYLGTERRDRGALGFRS